MELCMMKWTCRCCLWLIFSVSVVVGVTVPSDVTVQQGGTATLICRLGSPITGLALWLEGATAFADKDQILPDAPAKYSNFEIVSDDTAIGQMDLRINNAQYEDRGTYICQFGGTPDGSATLEVQVPATSLTIAINGTTQSPDATVIVTAGTQVTLVCTSLGAKPKVTLDWFKGSEPLGPDTETIPSGGEATDTLSTIDSFIPTRADDQNRIECRTVGHISSQSQYITLNVYFAPVVTSLTYSNGMITCEADANPITNIEYYIILNGTKPSLPTGKTLAFDVDKNYCTQVSCSVTNSVGTRSKELEEPLCPEPETTAPTSIHPVTSLMMTTVANPSIGAVVGAVVAAFILGGIICGLIIFCLMRKRNEQHRRVRGQSKNARDDEGYSMPDRQHNTESHRSWTDLDVTSDDRHNAVVYESIQDDSAAARPTSTTMYGNVGPDLSFSRDLLDIEMELGQGAFGKVLLGTALGIEEAGKRTKVAMKTVKEGADGQAKMELLSELKLMKTVGSHPNVVKLLGHCTESDPVYIIVEYLAKGDLKKVLLGYRDKDQGGGYSNPPSLSKSLSQILVKFARDVANGMAFLSSQKCVHRDLAARNVLVGEDLVCKVSDFGMARDVMNIRIYQRESQGPIPMRWMALESLLDDVYTTESDVWSFGVLLWEIVTLGARPYPMMKAKTMVSQLQQGYRMPKPQHCKKELYAMMCSCWQKIPQDRPTFQSLYQQLNDMLSEDKDYITFNKLDESIYEVTVIHASNEKL